MLIDDFLNSVDEIGAVVLNVGQYETKAGEAGDDTPKVVFSTVRMHHLHISHVFSQWVVLPPK